MLKNNNKISVGGDCDATTAISCAIAEAFHGAPEELEKQVMARLPEDMVEIIEDAKFLSNMQ